MSIPTKIEVMAELISVELTCIKCRNLDYKQLKEETKSKTTYFMNSVVFHDHKCTKCGCNTFDLDMEIGINPKIN